MIFLYLSFFVNYILSFGLVGLWTIQLSAGAGAGAHIEYSSCSHAVDMIITNVIIKTPDRKCNWGVYDVMPGSEGLRIWWFLKKAVSWDLTLGRASPVGGVDCGQCRNSQHSKNCVSLSSCRKTKSQEVNKCFVPEQRESSVFCIPHAYVYVTGLCTSSLQHKFWQLRCKGLNTRVSQNFCNSLIHSKFQCVTYVTMQFKPYKQYILSYLPTPPLGQEMTQGQFFKRSLTGLNSEFSYKQYSPVDPFTWTSKGRMTN